MSKAEPEDFHVSGRVRLSDFNGSNNRAKKPTLSIPEVPVADEETVKSAFALPDELIAKVLSYLPLRDRFRLETVCRQWKRCMYLEVQDLVLYFRHEVDQKYTFKIIKEGEITIFLTEELPAVLHKLRISKVDRLTCVVQDVLSNKELFVLLADIASRATIVIVYYGIRCHPSNLVPFCDIFGPHVTSFQLTLGKRQGLPENIQAFADSLARMKRLKEVSSNWLNLVFTCLNSFPTNSLPHLQGIKPRFSSECDRKLWEHFKSLYGAQIKKITFLNGHWQGYQREVWLPWKDMAPFANLEHLDFSFRLCDCTLTALAEDLEATCRSCPHLKSLGLREEDFTFGVVVSLMELRKLFVAIGKMKMLKKLDLYLEFLIEDFREISLEENLHFFALLENKSNITHLKANVKLFQISSESGMILHGIFGCLNSAMPNIRNLDVYCMASELDHFVGLESMQIIHLDYFHSMEASGSVQDSLIRILKSTPSLRSIKFRQTFAEVSEALIGTIIEVAELQMEKHIDFFAEIGVNKKFQEAWEAMKHLAPRNLTLTFEES